MVTRNLREKKRLDRLWRPHSFLMKYMTTVWQFKDFLILKPCFMLRYQTNDLWISKLFCKLILWEILIFVCHIPEILLNGHENSNFIVLYTTYHITSPSIPHVAFEDVTLFLAPWYFSFFALCMMPFKLCLLHG